MTVAKQILTSAIQHQDRGAVKYDSPEGERSMEDTVAAFNAYTHRNISVKEGWLFMECLKTVRSLRNDGQLDDFEDLASYASLRGEEHFKNVVPNSTPKGNFQVIKTMLAVTSEEGDWYQVKDIKNNKYISNAMQKNEADILAAQLNAESIGTAHD